MLTEKPRSILIVEDDPDIGRLMLQVLRTSASCVLLVADRDEAADALLHAPFACIVLDVAMPGMSLDEFVKLPQARGHALVIVSAVVDPELTAKGMGVTQWLRKPFDPAELVAVVRGFSPSRLQSA